MSNSLDTQNVGPDLGPNNLQRLADDKSPIERKEFMPFNRYINGT